MNEAPLHLSLELTPPPTSLNSSDGGPGTPVPVLRAAARINPNTVLTGRLAQGESIQVKVEVDAPRQGLTVYTRNARGIGALRVEVSQAAHTDQPWRVDVAGAAHDTGRRLPYEAWARFRQAPGPGHLWIRLEALESTPFTIQVG